jgi:predicted Zn-ribbon and HTH transcriptional regulator
VVLVFRAFALWYWRVSVLVDNTEEIADVLAQVEHTNRLLARLVNHIEAQPTVRTDYTCPACGFSWHDVPAEVGIDVICPRCQSASTM